MEDKISPDALWGRAKRTGEFAVIVCTKTVYNYIDLGILHIKSIDLPLRVRRNNKRHHCRQNRRILRESIENRPEPVNARQEFGHWEIDTVVGQRTAGEVLLTLDERTTRRRYIIRILDKTKASVAVGRALLCQTYGDNFHLHVNFTTKSGSPTRKSLRTAFVIMGRDPVSHAKHATL